MGSIFSNNSKPYRVMLIVQSLRVGGAEMMVENLAYALMAMGCVVLVVVLQPGETIITSRMRGHGVVPVVMGKKPGMDLKLIGRLADVMRDFQPDVVHSHLPILHYVVPAAERAGVTNMVHTLHSVASKETRSKLKAAFYGHLYRKGIVRPVALGEITAESIVERYRVNRESIAIVPNGIDLSLYRCNRDYAVEGTMEVAHVGRFEGAKNHALIVECAKLLKERDIPVRFHLYGVGSLFNEMKNRVEKFQLYDVIFFHGLVDDVPRVLAQADAFIFPSLYEGMPMVLVEAMASGLPIVSSKVGGIPDMVDDGESAILSDLIASEFADALQSLFSDASLRKRIGSAALARSVEFGSDFMARRYCSVYMDAWGKE